MRWQELLAVDDDGTVRVTEGELPEGTNVEINVTVVTEEIVESDTGLEDWTPSELIEPEPADAETILEFVGRASTGLTARELSTAFPEVGIRGVEAALETLTEDDALVEDADGRFYIPASDRTRGGRQPDEPSGGVKPGTSYQDVLEAVAEVDEPLTRPEIRERSSDEYTDSALSAALTRLTQWGYVAAIDGNDLDRIVLTEKGQEWLEEQVVTV